MEFRGHRTPKPAKEVSTINFQSVDRSLATDIMLYSEFDCFPNPRNMLNGERFVYFPYVTARFAKTNIIGKNLRVSSQVVGAIRD
jgi:hypothetical protein